MAEIRPLSARASSAYNTNYSASMMIDGKTSTRWSSSTGSKNDWVEFDLQVVQTFSRLIIRIDPAYPMEPITTRVYTSPDRASQTLVFSGQIKWSGNVGVIDLPAEVSTQYVRVHFDGYAVGGGTIAEFTVDTAATSYPLWEQVIADVPRYAYRMGDPSATLLMSAYAGTDGTHAKTTTLGPAVSPGGIGSRRYVNDGEPSKLPVNDTLAALTFEAWVRPEELGPLNIIGTAGPGAGARRWALYLDSGALRLIRWYGTTPVVDVAGGSIPVGIAAHVAWSGDASDSKVYLNGSEVASAKPTSAPAQSSTYPITIGAASTTYGSRQFRGFVSDVAVFDRVLPPDRIQAHAGLAAPAVQPFSGWGIPI